MLGVFLDTETVSLNKDASIIQLSYVTVDISGKSILKNPLRVHSEYCSPGTQEMGFEAMAVNHITPEMVEGKPVCKDTEAYKFLELLNKSDVFLIAQNVDFDMPKLEAIGFQNKMQVIDTLKVSKNIFSQYPKHNLQYLRYALGLYKREKEVLALNNISEIKAHDALGDVIVSFILFDEMLKHVTVQEMLDMQSKPTLEKYLGFGKYKGKTYEEVARADIQYLDWVLKNFQGLSKDSEATIKHWIKKSMVKA